MTGARPLTADERERLAPVLSQTEIPVRVSEVPIEPIEDVISLHGEATGWRSGDRRIVLSSQAFDRLDDEQLRALLAHEIGHHRGRHPLLHRAFKTAVLACAVPIVPAGLAVGLFLPWAAVLYVVVTAVYVLFVVFGGAWLSRRLDLDADRRAVELLGATEPLEALVRPEVTEPPTGLRDRVGDLCFPWPRSSQRLASLDRLAGGGCD